MDDTSLVIEKCSKFKIN